MLEKIVQGVRRRVESAKRKAPIYALALASALPFGLSGCATFKPQFQPYINPIEKQSTEIITHPEPNINKDIIFEGELPKYKQEYTTTTINGTNFISYSPRYVEATGIKTALEEQLPEVVKKISHTSGTNELLISLNNSDTPSLETKIDDVMKLVKMIDKPVDQILLIAKIIEVYGDFTQDISTFLKLTQLKQEGWDIYLDSVLPGVLPTALSERDKMKTIIGLLYGDDKIKFDTAIDMLKQQGVAKSYFNTPIVLQSGKSADLESTLEFPYMKETITGGGAVLRSTDFKLVPKSIKITKAEVRADQKLYLELEMVDSTRVPVGHEQNYYILTKKIKIDGVNIGRGVELVVAGAEQEREAGVSRRFPIPEKIEGTLKKIPVLRELVYLVAGRETDISRSRTYFAITGYVVDTSKKPDYTKAGMKPEHLYKKEGGILQFPLLQQIPPPPK